MAEAATAKRLCGKQPKISPRQEERIRSTLAHGPSDSPSTDPPSAAREKRPGHRGLGLLAEPLPTPHLPATQRHRTDFPDQDQPAKCVYGQEGVAKARIEAALALTSAVEGPDVAETSPRIPREQP